MRSRPVSLCGLSAVLLAVFAPLGVVAGRSCFAVPPAASGAAVSASNPRVHLAPADAQTLADALHALANQAPGVSFVAEGKPYRARNSAPPLAPSVQKWPAEGLPLQEAVEKIATVYDYQAERKGDVFLLRKRYTNAADLPDVTMDELKLALRDIVRAASGLPAPVADMPSFDQKNSPFTTKFYETLTPEQIKKLSGDATFVYVRDMNPAQKRMLQDLAVSRHIQNAVGEAQKAQAAVRECDQKTTAFGWTDMTATEPDTKKTQTARALCCMVRENRKTALIPFAPNGRMLFRFSNRRISYREAGDNQDSSAPTAADYDEKHELSPPEETGPDTFTLQALAQTLHEKAVASRVGVVAPSFVAHEALAVKSVTVVGDLGGSAEAVWRAVGDVYGLSVVRTEEDGPLRMQRPRPQIAHDLAGLNAAAFAAFPAPLIRLYRSAYNTEEAERLKKSRPSYLQPQEGESAAQITSREEQWADRTRFMAKFQTPGRLKDAALHRFRVLAEPRIAETTEKRVLYSELNDKAHDLWTLALFVDCLENASGLENQTLPPSITAFDKGYLSAHINDGFGSIDPYLHFTFWTNSEKGYSNVDGGGVFPVPATFPKPDKKKP